MNRNNGFFFGNETTAHIHSGKAPEECLFFFSGEAVYLSGLDQECAAVEVTAPFFGVAA